MKEIDEEINVCKDHSPMYTYFNVSREQWEKEIKEILMSLADRVAKGMASGEKGICEIDLVEHIFGKEFTESQIRKLVQFARAKELLLLATPDFERQFSNFFKE